MASAAPSTSCLCTCWSSLCLLRVTSFIYLWKTLVIGFWDSSNSARFHILTWPYSQTGCTKAWTQLPGDYRFGHISCSCSLYYYYSSEDCCSSRGPEFNAHHPHQTAPVTLAPEDLMHSFGLCELLNTYGICSHRYTHIHHLKRKKRRNMSLRQVIPIFNANIFWNYLHSSITGRQTLHDYLINFLLGYTWVTSGNPFHRSTLCLLT